MNLGDDRLGRGFSALRRAVAEQLSVLGPPPPFLLAGADATSYGAGAGPEAPGRLWALTAPESKPPSRKPSPKKRLKAVAPPPDAPAPHGPDGSDHDLAVSSLADEAEADRLIALVELARGGDSDAFGMLYDHYQPSVYRFLYYRVGSVTLAEDLTSETFFRALRSMSSFRWQGKDFGAWLMTIARNLTTDHFKSSRTRLESTTEDMTAHDSPTEGPESAVLASMTNEALLKALKELPAEQQDCLVMRFLQGLSIAETAQLLGRSDGAVKQLQLRGVRNLAKLMPEGLR